MTTSALPEPAVSAAEAAAASPEEAEEAEEEEEEAEGEAGAEADGEEEGSVGWPAAAGEGAGLGGRGLVKSADRFLAEPLAFDAGAAAGEALRAAEGWAKAQFGRVHALPNLHATAGRAPGAGADGCKYMHLLPYEHLG